MPAKLRAAAAPHPIASHLSINRALSVHHQMFLKLFTVARIETGSQELKTKGRATLVLFFLHRNNDQSSSKFQYPVPSFRCESERGKATEVGIIT
jgi:hypothetical protein